MYYYIIDNRIVGFSEPLNPEFYSYQCLTQEQAKFYKDNPTANIGEVLNLSLMAEV